MSLRPALLGTEFRFDAGQARLARTVASGAIGEPRLATILLHVGVLADRGAVLPDAWADAGQGGEWALRRRGPLGRRRAVGVFSGPAEGSAR